MFLGGGFTGWCGGSEPTFQCKPGATGRQVVPLLAVRNGQRATRDALPFVSASELVCQRVQRTQLHKESTLASVVCVGHDRLFTAAMKPVGNPMGSLH